ncbi:MAG: hypothetical protein QM482_08535 [Sulfurospirillum sp.]
MSDFSIPHLAPVRFVKSLLNADEKSASVKIAFEKIPTLPMFIEAAAQSSSGIDDDENDGKMGFLVTLKNIKLLEIIDSREYIASIKLNQKIENFKSLSFEIFKNDTVIAKGTFSITLASV